MKNNRILSFEKNLAHEVSELICIKCYHRWIAAYPEVCRLKNLQCPCCNESGFVIKTGQTLDNEDEM